MNIFQRCYQGYKSWTQLPVGDQSCSSGDKMIVLHDEDTLLHETVELLGAKLKPALESPTRIRAIVDAVRASGKYDLRTLKVSREDKTTAIKMASATHDSDYLEHIETVFQSWLDAGLVEPDESVLPECFRLHNNAVKVLQPPKDIYARAGYYAFDMSTGITRNSWKSIVASANLAVQAARLLVPKAAATPTTSNTIVTNSPRSKSVLALCRPPGHHCTGQQAGGYCYINNIALTVTTLRHLHQAKQFQLHSDSTASPANTSVPIPTTTSSSPLKFAILDLDFHHGNGTQSLFYHDPHVLYISLHGQDEFPYYTGSTDERGPPSPHPAHNTNHNFPLPVNTPAETYKSTLSHALTIINEFTPDYLLVSLGFDTFHLDPLGKFDIDTEDYRDIAYMVRKEVGSVDAAVILEGGYVVDRLGENMLGFLDGWCGAEREREDKDVDRAGNGKGTEEEGK